MSNRRRIKHSLREVLYILVSGACLTQFPSRPPAHPSPVLFYQRTYNGYLCASHPVPPLSLEWAENWYPRAGGSQGFPDPTPHTTVFDPSRSSSWLLYIAPCALYLVLYLVFPTSPGFADPVVVVVLGTQSRQGRDRGAPHCVQPLDEFINTS